jgi:hypothetical protein
LYFGIGVLFFFSGEKRFTLWNEPEVITLCDLYRVRPTCRPGYRINVFILILKFLGFEIVCVLAFGLKRNSAANFRFLTETIYSNNGLFKIQDMAASPLIKFSS